LAITSSDLRLEAVWASLKSRGRTALIPYLTAGYPTRDSSLEVLRAVSRVADIIEVGVPFSDPLADGPTIQRSTFEALKQGMTLAGTFELVAQAETGVPIVIFSYLNPILSYGIDRFLADAGRLGIAGLILTDLPAGADPAIESAVHQSTLDLIRLIAPTTSQDRLARAVQGAEGFVYLVARLGVTGASASLASDLAEYVARVRRATALPVAVGFGISTPDQAEQVGAIADGVVVGSALVEVLGRDGVKAAGRFLGSLREALDRKDRSA
jgi:tryptophan synthase alpha chain